MKKEFSNLPLRKGVGIVLLNKENKIFVAKRIDNPKNFWQMPQGGIDGDENYYEAALRELKEETSITSVEFIHEIDEKLTYILPDHLIGIIWKGRFKGQTQKWFVMRFIGNESEINIKTKNPEFLDWKWIDLEDLTKIAVNFKLDVYKSLKREVSKILN
jgi:NTP pyrophosphohydrolases including oxidative damage repair enzymes